MLRKTSNLKQKSLFRIFFLALVGLLNVHWVAATGEATLSASSSQNQVSQSDVVSVQGVVKDDVTDDPLIGVSIVEKGTGNGTITNLDGAFSLKIKRNSILTISYLGYETQEIKIIEDRNLSITLKEDAVALDEVIVLGYGQEARKANLSVAVAQKKIGEEMKSRSGGVINALQGQIAGVTIASTGGDPASGSSVVIRGAGSRKGDSPLYVVDGVSGGTFNQEDVESITVLKDAASAAIYGTNVGSGGVILVTTKQAKAGKTQVTARGSYSIQNAWRKPKTLTAEEYVTVRTDAASLVNEAVPLGVNPQLYPYGQTTRTDWVDEIFRAGSVQNYAVTVAGGSEGLKAYGSAEYTTTEGILLNTYKRDFGARLNLDFKITEWMSLNQNVNFKSSNRQGGVNTDSHTGVIASALFMPRSATVYESAQDGSPIYDTYGNRKFGGTVPQWASDLGVAGTFGEVQNPVASLMRLNRSRPTQDIYSTTALTIRPMEGLKLTSTLSASAFNGKYTDFSPRIPEIGKPNLKNSRTIENWRTNKILWESVASYDKYFGKHNVSGMAGFSLTSEDYTYNKLYMYDFPNEDSHSQIINNAESILSSDQAENKEQQRQVSVYVRGAYSFDDRYFVTASVRRDATSKLYHNVNSGVFPAVSGGWNITNESFFDVDWISMLKVRASWGQIGNVGSVGKYSPYSQLAYNGEPIFLGADKGTQLIGLGAVKVPNLALTWETSEQTDIGFDFELFNGKLSIAGDYFIKKTKDLIEDRSLQSYYGVKEPSETNVGTSRNKGFELTIGYADRTAFGLTYSFSANATRLYSDVTLMRGIEYLHNDRTIRNMKPMRSTVGEAWNSFFLIEADGVFKTQAEVDAHVYTDATGNTKPIQPNAQVGDMKFTDHNNDGKINDDDRKYFGSYTPKWTYGFNGSLAYKGFDFGFVVQGVGGNKIFNGLKALTSEEGQGWNMNRDMINSWSYNQNSGIPRVVKGDPNASFSTASSYYIESGSYLRLKNVIVGYTIPKKVFKNIVEARIYATAENLLTVAPYSGMDPEVGMNGADGGKYPTPRVFTFGLNLVF